MDSSHSNHDTSHPFGNSSTSSPTTKYDMDVEVGESGAYADANKLGFRKRTSSIANAGEQNNPVEAIPKKRKEKVCKEVEAIAEDISFSDVDQTTEADSLLNKEKKKEKDLCDDCECIFQKFGSIKIDPKEDLSNKFARLNMRTCYYSQLPFGDSPLTPPIAEYLNGGFINVVKPKNPTSNEVERLIFHCDLKSKNGNFENAHVVGNNAGTADVEDFNDNEEVLYGKRILILEVVPEDGSGKSVSSFSPVAGETEITPEADASLLQENKIQDFQWTIVDRKDNLYLNEEIVLCHVKEALGMQTMSDDRFLRREILKHLLKYHKKIYIQDSAVNDVCNGADILQTAILKYDNGIEIDQEIIILTRKEELVAIAVALMSTSLMKFFVNEPAAQSKRIIMERDAYPKNNLKPADAEEEPAEAGLRRRTAGTADAANPNYSAEIKPKKREGQ